MADEIEDLMLDTTDDWLAGKNVPQKIASYKTLLNFTARASDYEKREAVGVAPVLPLIKNIKLWRHFQILLNVLQFEDGWKTNHFSIWCG